MHLFLGEAGIAEQAAGKLARQMLGAAGVERVGHQARIVDAGERDAVAGQRHHVEFGVLHDLQHRLVFEDRLEQVKAARIGICATAAPPRSSPSPARWASGT